MLINGEKWACEACVRGHRVSNCQHSGEWLLRALLYICIPRHCPPSHPSSPSCQVKDHTSTPRTNDIPSQHQFPRELSLVAGCRLVFLYSFFFFFFAFSVFFLSVLLWLRIEVSSPAGPYGQPNGSLTQDLFFGRQPTTKTDWRGAQPSLPLSQFMRNLFLLYGFPTNFSVALIYLPTPANLNTNRHNCKIG